MRTYYVSLFLVLLGLSANLHAAESQTVTGVVTNVSTTNQTITIRNDATLERRTYFLSADTRLSAGGQPIELNRIRRGHEVSISYRSTDRGREIVSFNVPDPASVTDVPAVASSEPRRISGTVTGVRPSKRTITIREDETRTRRTLTVPEDAPVTRNGDPIGLRSIQPGDHLMARYRVTDSGLMLVTGRSPEPEPVVEAVQEAPVELPKTASPLFGYLLAGFGLLLGGTLLRLRRRLS